MAYRSSSKGGSISYAVPRGSSTNAMESNLDGVSDGRLGEYLPNTYLKPIDARKASYSEDFDKLSSEQAALVGSDMHPRHRYLPNLTVQPKLPIINAKLGGQSVSPSTIPNNQLRISGPYDERQASIVRK